MQHIKKSIERGFHLSLPVVQRCGYEFACASSWADWTMYRMPLLQMQSLADQSTQLRATWNFLTHGLKKTDNAARAKLKNHDFFGPFLYQCLHYEYIIIRGISCENCTAATKLGSFSSWTSNSYKSKTEFGCDLDGSPGVNRSENSFGQYRWNTTNSAHRCSSFCLYNSVLAWICLQPVNLRFKKQQIAKKLCRLFLQTPE